MKFYENLFSHTRVVTYGQADRQTDVTKHISRVYQWLVTSSSPPNHKQHRRKQDVLLHKLVCFRTVGRGVDTSLVRPGRKQATATRLGIYSTYSPQSSIHFLARWSNFCKPLTNNSEGCPSNQVSAAKMTFASDEKWRPSSWFFSPRNRW